MRTPRPADSSPCGLLALRTPRRLKWDLDGERALEFGSLISSSNQIVGSRVTVETDAPLLWTTGLRRQARSHQ